MDPKQDLRVDEASLTASAGTPALLFFTSTRSGPARRMESLLALMVHRERGRLRLETIDADDSRKLADALGISTIPTLVLLRDRRPVARIEGKATGPQIEAMLDRHLPGRLDLRE